MVLSETIERVTGLLLPGLAVFEIVPQPDGDCAYVSSAPGAVTLFGCAARHGVTGLLAHNYLAGEAFARLGVGQRLVLVDGRAGERVYRVSEIARFRRVQPGDITSPVVSLDDGRVFSCVQAFDRFYTGAHRLTLQTCLARGWRQNYGLVFVTAWPEGGQEAGRSVL